MCSYQPECEYDCIVDFKKSKLNYDTMDVSTFLPYLIQIAEYVYDIYNYNIALTIDEIYDQLSMLINVDKYVVYLAIEYDRRKI